MEELKFPKFSRFDGWFRPKGARAVFILIVILLLIVGTYFFVYITGGITYVYSHSMYIAIILAALFFRIPGGILAGIIGGLVLGPIMPLNVNTGEMQSTINWLYRLIIFTLTGGFLGFVTSVIDNQLRRIEWQFYHNPLTGLPILSYLELLIQRMNQEIGIIFMKSVIPLGWKMPQPLQTSFPKELIKGFQLFPCVSWCLQ